MMDRTSQGPGTSDGRAEAQRYEDLSLFANILELVRENYVEDEIGRPPSTTKQSPVCATG